MVSGHVAKVHINSPAACGVPPTFQKCGYKYAESNPELETNQKVQSQWQYFETQQHKRRRAFGKDI